MFTVRQEGDKVLIDRGGRRRDLLLTCAGAEKLAGALRVAAGLAEREPPAPCHAEVWEVRAESFDGLVALRFTPPPGAAPGRVPLPAGVARQLADLLDWKRSQAEHKLRILVRGN